LLTFIVLCVNMPMNFYFKCFGHPTHQMTWDNRMTVCELPLLDLRKSCTDVFGKRAIDGYMHCLVGWMSKALDERLGFTFSME